jgi:hypothetical protein
VEENLPCVAFRCLLLPSLKTHPASGLSIPIETVQISTAYGGFFAAWGRGYTLVDASFAGKIMVKEKNLSFMDTPDAYRKINIIITSYTFDLSAQQEIFPASVLGDVDDTRSPQGISYSSKPGTPLPPIILTCGTANLNWVYVIVFPRPLCSLS